MARDVRRRSIDIQDLGENDVLAGLWEQAVFPRLPGDAPPTLREHLEDVENPKRVYTVHKASRRHNFQLLVQKFVIQLRDGCGSSSCDTPSCFSCRKRVVGRAPIRRYNTTSARTLAIVLASQDNPESALCPSLRPSRTPPAALNSLIFASKPPPLRLGQNGPLRGPAGKGKSNALGSPPSPRTSSDRRNGSHLPEPASRDGSSEAETDSNRPSGAISPNFTVTEKPVSKDYRSFAANVFGSVAFKMLEWLTPASLEEMSRRAGEFNGEPSRQSSSSPGITATSSKRAGDDISPTGTGPPSSRSSPQVLSLGTSTAASSTSSGVTSPSSPAAKPADAENGTSETSVEKPAASAKGEKPQTPTSTSLGSAASPRPGCARRNSNARVRTQSSAKPKRNVSIDTFATDPAADELLSAVKSPRLPSLSQDKTARTALKSATTPIPRPISQLSIDDVPLETMPPPKTNATNGRSRTALGLTDSGGTHGGERTSRSPVASSSSDRSYVAVSPCQSDSAFESEFREFLPQSMYRLTPELVGFFCDLIQDDGTYEKNGFEPRRFDESNTLPVVPSTSETHSQTHSRSRRSEPLQRIPRPVPTPYPDDMKHRWQLFIEQSFFYVLSDPRLLIRSFTKKGQLYDSQTLWYCMLRMNRVTPSVVVHSLWQAAAALFVPPGSVRSSLRSSPAAAAARLFPSSRRRRGDGAADCSLSNEEAGMLLSIGLHMLMAVVPFAASKEEMHEMSRLRAHGLILSMNAGNTKATTDKQELRERIKTANRCLAYDDAFSNELALRLARRLFASIPTRHYFDQMAALGDLTPSSSADNELSSLASTSGEEEAPDVLTPLFRQLDFLNLDTQYILDFPILQRADHEVRAPTLLLDWARTVMLNEWDGEPEVPADGPFGGALALIKAMYHKRSPLFLADGQFFADYFGERLDEVQVPISWLSFTPTRQRVHLLDFPFLFSPAKLVSFFRSINFSRMSRSFEESSSLQERVVHITPPRSNLVTNPYHQYVLNDMLRTALSKYLVLSVSRERVLEDAFDQLWRREERELMRPLKVKLGERTGEEGFDSGGVQQEFFRMAVAEALNPDFGAFTVDERTRMTWFNPGSPEPDWKFELIGLIFSLAVYNGLTLPVTFPEAFYRKLLGEPVTELHHISDGWPDLASGLTALLDWDENNGSVEDVFARTYEFSVSVFGEPVSREMRSPGAAAAEWPAFPSKHCFGGASSSASQEPLHEGNPTDAPMVTRANRDAYVTDYIRYLTDVSVRPQYEAFARGFRACLNPKSLHLLTPKLLQSVVEGVQEIDVAELRRHARYVGWDASHRSVRDFWAVVRRFDDVMLRRLLEFVTASDRVPVGGVKNIQFVVQRNGEEEGEGGHLPTAYTCYGTLLLPEYRDREVLRERLSMALQNAQGFGFA